MDNAKAENLIRTVFAQCKSMGAELFAYNAHGNSCFVG